MQHRRHVVCLFRQQQMKVQFVTQRCTAQMHNVLYPEKRNTSVDVAERRAEERGPKTCLQKSRTWSPLAPCGLQPGPLALSCMAMTMHTGESLALFHSHAGQFLYETAMNLSQVSCTHSWGSTSRSLLAFVCALGMSATIPRAAVTCDYHVTVSPRTHEQLRDKRTLCYAFTPWSTVSHMAGDTSCTFVMLAQSAFPLCRPIRGFLYCWLQPRCDPPTNLLFGRALTLRSWRPGQSQLTTRRRPVRSTDIPR